MDETRCLQLQGEDHPAVEDPAAEAGAVAASDLQAVVGPWAAAVVWAVVAALASAWRRVIMGLAPSGGQIVSGQGGGARPRRLPRHAQLWMKARMSAFSTSAFTVSIPCE